MKKCVNIIIESNEVFDPDSLSLRKIIMPRKTRKAFMKILTIKNLTVKEHKRVSKLIQKCRTGYNKYEK